MSRPQLAHATPVTPPNVNSTMNPNVNNNGISTCNDPPYIVASYENTLIPVGTAIIIVAAVK